MIQRNKRRGFTLIELLVVLAILSVVTTLGATSFIQMTSLWSDTSARMDLNAKCVNVFNMVRNDTERIISAQRSGRAIKGVDALEEEATLNRHYPENDELILPIQQRRMGEGPWEQLAVRYSIDRTDPKNPQLVRTVGPNDGSVPSQGAQVLAEAVVSMNVAYLDGEKGWVKQWPGAHHPEAVRVSLAIGMVNRPGEHISREAVFPIHVK